MTLHRAKGTGQPMVYVTTRCSMDSEEIATKMGELFNKLELFLTGTGVTPSGPPLAIYRDWDGAAMTMQVGFPVGEADLAKASGEVLAGHAPSEDAVKSLHRGPYPSLRDTYGEMEREMKQAGIAMSDVAWEVYVSDPVTTPADELVTEIYMAVSPEDAAKAQAA